MNGRIIFAVTSLAILLFSGFVSRDRATWLMEVAPILISLPILLATWKRYTFTTLVYVLLILHYVILSVGGIYTYAEVPLGYWMQDWFGFTRNNYDKIGHFAQGFIPALVARELLLSTSPLRPGKWLQFIVGSICFAVSAMYEIIEWWTSVAQGASAEAFLGTQGYEWDSQSDMLFCLIGATTSLILLSKVQDRLLSKR